MFSLIKPRVGNVSPCWRCGKNQRTDCGYGTYDYFGDFDCNHPELEEVCDDCPLCFCQECKKELNFENA